MKLMIERVAGLDVHKRSVTACVRTPGEHDWNHEVRTFRTFTQHLLEMRDWLEERGVTHVTMEATGVFWKPVWWVLEGHFELVLTNPRHVKRVPGRKTDVTDAEWLAELTAYGLVAASFVPGPEIRRLRDLTRYRTRLTQLRTQELQRMAKILEDAGIKLDSVASTLATKSARAMIEALCEGERDPEVLAQMAKARMRSKIPELRLALEGRFSEHHGRLLALMMRHADDLEADVGRLNGEIAALAEPLVDDIERLSTVPGIARTTAEVILAETGGDMSRFPTAGHLASWAGMCPGQYESAGKQRFGKTRPGNKWLREALRMAAVSAASSRDTYLASQYWQLVPRRGKAKAAVAVGHSLLVIAWHVLSEKSTYQELGGDWFIRLRNPERQTRRLVEKLEALGHRVTIEPAA
jgi:transposase